MAIGINPKQTKSIPAGSFSTEQFLALACETFSKIGWNFNQTSDNAITATTKFSMSSWSERVTVEVLENEVIITSRCTGIQLVDWGKNNENIERFITQLNKLIDSVTAEELAALVEKHKYVSSTSPGEKGNVEILEHDFQGGILSVFIPVKGYYITPILVIVNIAVFVLMIASGVHFLAPDVDSLIAWGANFRPVTLNGGWWRLFTSCFLHIGVLHLLMNMYALIYIGMLLEQVLGKTRFLLAYLVTGITASAVSLYWNQMSVSAGASGAIFGMYGIFLALLTTNLIEKTTRKTLLTSILIFVGYNLLNGFQEGIDNAAHVGGLLTGLLVGGIFVPAIKNQASVQTAKITGNLAVAVPLIVSAFLFLNTTDDMKKFNDGMIKFQSMEMDALSVFDMPDSTPVENYLHELNEGGIDVWKECIVLLREMDELDIPIQLHDQNKKLVKYCDLRVNSYRLISKSVIAGSDFLYADSIAYYDQEIEAVILSLSEE